MSALLLPPSLRFRASLAFIYMRSPSDHPWRRCCWRRVLISPVWTPLHSPFLSAFDHGLFSLNKIRLHDLLLCGTPRSETYPTPTPSVSGTIFQVLSRSYRQIQVVGRRLPTSLNISLCSRLDIAGFLLVLHETVPRHPLQSLVSPLPYLSPPQNARFRVFLALSQFHSHVYVRMIVCGRWAVTR